MTRAISISKVFIVAGLLIASCRQCFGQDVERAAIDAHQDQLQNLILDCQETRHHDIDRAAASSGSAAAYPQIDLVRSEMSSVRFSFLNGNARYDRVTDSTTLKYWASKGLPAIASQMQSISSSGRVGTYKSATHERSAPIVRRNSAAQSVFSRGYDRHCAGAATSRCPAMDNQRRSGCNA